MVIVINYQENAHHPSPRPRPQSSFILSPNYYSSPAPNN